MQLVLLSACNLYYYPHATCTIIRIQLEKVSAFNLNYYPHSTCTIIRNHLSTLSALNFNYSSHSTCTFSAFNLHHYRHSTWNIIRLHFVLSSASAFTINRTQFAQLSALKECYCPHKIYSNCTSCVCCKLYLFKTQGQNIKLRKTLHWDSRSIRRRGESDKNVPSWQFCTKKKYPRYSSRSIIIHPSNMGLYCQKHGHSWIWILLRVLIIE